MDTKILNFDSYNTEMKKSLLDKIFFIDKVDTQVFVDFGCADGELIKFLYSLFPDFEYIGYDINPEMIKLAQSNVSNVSKNIHFTSDWKEVLDLISERKATLILNSVIHEVYSYSNLVDNEEFWKRIFNGTFDYIVVRDMLPKQSINKRSDINDIAYVRKRANKAHLKDFENHWGSIEDNRNLVHFLLKYRWEENWEREVKENYFPLYAEYFLEKIPDKYHIDFYDEFVLPFTKRKIKEDFNICLKDTTHIKCILRRHDVQ